jgi:hypothetical protein
MRRRDPGPHRPGSFVRGQSRLGDNVKSSAQRRGAGAMRRDDPDSEIPVFSSSRLLDFSTPDLAVLTLARPVLRFA